MVAFGALSATNGRLVVYGWLFDTRNTANPQVLGKQYNEAASEDMARTMAHRFADEIISRLGGGINGIAETKIYFVSTRSGSKEIWAMDYDGQNQHQVTHLGSISLSPRISPDNSRIAFSSLGTRRMVDPHVFPGTGPDGELSRQARPAAATSLLRGLRTGRRLHSRRRARETRRSGWRTQAAAICTESPHLPGPNVAPVWNPRTNAQLAFVGGRTSEPQIYTMDQDGSNMQRMTDSGYAVSPSWAPERRPAHVQLESQVRAGRSGRAGHLRVRDCQHALAAGDARVGQQRFSVLGAGRTAYCVSADDWAAHPQIWTMLADGTHQQQLTHAGDNSMPNWSWK